MEACGTEFNWSNVFHLLHPYSQKYGDSKTGSLIQLEHEMLGEDLWIMERRDEVGTMKEHWADLSQKCLLFNNISEGKTNK